MSFNLLFTAVTPSSAHRSHSRSNLPTILIFTSRLTVTSSPSSSSFPSPSSPPYIFSSFDSTQQTFPHLRLCSVLLLSLPLSFLFFLASLLPSCCLNFRHDCVFLSVSLAITSYLLTITRLYVCISPSFSSHLFAVFASSVPKLVLPYASCLYASTYELSCPLLAHNHLPPPPYLSPLSPTCSLLPIYAKRLLLLDHHLFFFYFLLAVSLPSCSTPSLANASPCSSLITYFLHSLHHRLASLLLSLPYLLPCLCLLHTNSTLLCFRSPIPYHIILS